MYKSNKEHPIIVIKCQCYRKDTLELVACDMDRAARKGFVIAAKFWAMNSFLV